MGNYIDNCPYCKKRYCVEPAAFEQALKVEDPIFYMHCRGCDRMIEVRFKVTAKLIAVEKTNVAPENASILGEKRVTRGYLY